MGNSKSGNRNPRPRKAEDKKSRLIQFRLHPENENEAWAMERIAYYAAHDISIRKLFIESLAALEGVDLPNRKMIVGEQKLESIDQAVRWLVGQVESGALGQVKGKRSREKTMSLPKQLQQTIQHYLDGGISADDD